MFFFFAKVSGALGSQKYVSHLHSKLTKKYKMIKQLISPGFNDHEVLWPVESHHCDEGLVICGDHRDTSTAMESWVHMRSVFLTNTVRSDLRVLSYSAYNFIQN